ncbi:MAG: VapC toxin family PIN domain ribonuclease, partial [Woeseiaceae bacterium]|nr:VapC toxin family PIN domain ribonuclease [Woeseiaceae bacterium]
MIVVDSSVWIDYFTGKNSPGVEKLDSLLGEELLAIGDL